MINLTITYIIHVLPGCYPGLVLKPPPLPSGQLAAVWPGTAKLNNDKGQQLKLPQRAPPRLRNVLFAAGRGPSP